ncbi:MAG: restriction endonuclease [Chloroflexota bacterium]
MASPKPEEFGLNEDAIHALDSQLWRARLVVAIFGGFIGLGVALKIGYDFFAGRSRDPNFDFFMIAVPLSIFVGVATGMFFFIIALQTPLTFWPEQIKVRRYRRAIKEAKVHEQQRLTNYWSKISTARLQREVLDLYRNLGYEVAPPPAGTEQFADHLITKDGVAVLMACQPQHTEVGFEPVRSLAGAVKAKKADRAIIVSIPGFTKQARRYSQGKSVGLISVPELANIQRFLEQQAAAEALGEPGQSNYSSR